MAWLYGVSPYPKEVDARGGVASFLKEHASEVAHAHSLALKVDGVILSSGASIPKDAQTVEVIEMPEGWEQPKQTEGESDG